MDSVRGFDEEAAGGGFSPDIDLTTPRAPHCNFDPKTDDVRRRRRKDTRHPGGEPMNKISVLLIVAVAAAAPAVAAPKKSAQQVKSPEQMTYEEAMEHNAKSWRLVQEGLPLVLPSWAIPIYFMIKGNNEAQQPAAKKTKK